MKIDQINLNFYTLFDAIEKAAKKGNFSGEEWRGYSDTKITHIISGLALKSNTHNKAALKLLNLGFLGEGIILIRSSYEATLVMDYLYYFQDEITEFLAISDIEDLNNYRMWPKVTSIDPDKIFDGATKSLRQHLDHQQKEIEETFKAHEIKEKIKSKLSKGPEKHIIWKKMGEIIEQRNRKFIEQELKTDPLSSPIFDFLIYKFGSTLVHPNWNVILRYYLKPKGQENKTEYSEAECFIVMTLLSEQLLVSLYNVQLIEQNHFKDLYTSTLRLRKEIQKFHKNKNNKAQSPI